MASITLCYHDVISEDDANASGFPGADAATYKLPLSVFCNHIKAIASVVDSTSPKYSVRLTFDDGGVSSCHIADILERHGLRGFFFVPTDYIGARAFLNARQILDLRHRGHIIGSHSCSHRGRMSGMLSEALVQEWNRSVAILSDLVGERVTTASVPSGYYCRRVAEMAASAGLTLLFTLQPTTRTDVVNGCAVAGRYMMRRYTPANEAARIASGALMPRLGQQIFWNTKKILKAAPLYAKVRRLYFEHTAAPKRAG
jgi:peptidoglycan/xylan/chitin deacetylase (PgdA/CDA1 family)